MPWPLMLHVGGNLLNLVAYFVVFCAASVCVGLSMERERRDLAYLGFALCLVPFLRAVVWLMS